ncbi:uncharacterized protein TNCV_797601 [Trichonephila clavipes]|nr:uncharacterized protein TNCV_797601 [Trichonephila clavipes]
MQSDSDSTMCAKNSDILLAENSLMDTEISISDEGSHAGEKEQYLNASLSKLQMFPSTSTFCTIVRKHHEDLLGTANGVIDITVSYDGTWQKRGHSSLYGIGIVIDILTGLIIDYEILSKYCPECTTAKRDLGENSAEYSIWYKSHQKECSKNYVGSSNAMEVKAAEILWKRSIKNCGMRYVSILSDGDAKTYQHLSSLNVYGNCIKIAKEECINHMAKRLGTGLRNKILEWRNKGITIGGRKEGNLKENTIVKLTNFYRKAIKDNAPDVRKMKSAILASLFHCSSTDKTPKHSKCPTGSTSWCFYQRALAKNENPMSHSLMKTKLSEQVLEKYFQYIKGL